MSSRTDLLDVLNRVQGLPILVVGDLILDRYIWGSVERISPEAPVPIVDVTKTEDRLGGAGNVVRNLSRIGCRVSVCGVVGDDKEGQTVLSLLAAEGARREGVMIDRERPTCSKTRVIAQRQQVVRVDRESREVPNLAVREGLAAMVDSQLQAASSIVLSDYGKGCISETLFRRLSEARARGVTSFPKRAVVLDPHPANYHIYSQVNVAKPNRREAESGSGVKITDVASASAAAKVLLEKWQADLLMVTLGEDGLLIQTRTSAEPLIRPTVAREVFDVSGAGDTVTAIFAAAVAAGASPILAGDLANIGAGIVVSEVGTVAVSREMLLRGIDQFPQE